MFKPVSSKVSFPEMEEKILKKWQEEKTFEKSIENRKGKKKFTFYDGPPFATGLPHYGHILAMTIKDAITRLKTMQGFYVPRRLGWDCHGLPVEYEVEKELKISGKKQIEEMGIEKFCQECKNIVFRYTKEWEKTIDRMGRWVDKKNTYATLELPYMESIWWVLKSIWDKDLIFQGFKSMPYCPRCGTPLSNFETNLGYKDNISDPSVFIKFELKDEPKTYFLAWTTTPWTLPGNAALAIGSDIKYVKIKVGDENLILSKNRLGVLNNKYEILQEFSSRDLVGREYHPLYDFVKPDKKAYFVVEAPFVSDDDGTGIIHIAPAFGEDDLELGRKENLPIIKTVNDRGELTQEIKPWAGLFVKDADPKIIEDLKNRNLLYKTETITHTYPFCWRCESPLIYYAISTWFIKVSEIVDRLIANNKEIHWMPPHVKEGRFGKWLEGARDWAVSRNRFWGTPLPIWFCPDCKEYQCVGSIEELREKAINPEKIGDLHRPYIDEVLLKCPKCSGSAHRIPEVLDCWFESGSMPYAQDHYPFENEEEFNKNFPADFIAEGLDQTRGWFYTLHILSTILFDKPAFKNCVVNGMILDKNGKKLSKRLRNYPEPEEVFNKFGADSLRFLFLSSPASLAEELRFSDEAVEEIVRKLFLILWNVYSFFITYANLDNWGPDDKKNNKELKLIDQWILSRLNSLIKTTTEKADNYDLPGATKPILDFINNDLSTWYVRRIRDRVGPASKDKNDAYAVYETLYEVLLVLTKILAPFSPFLTDEIYSNLIKKNGKDSVHLEDWPLTQKDLIKPKLEKNMNFVRKIVEIGHSLRKDKSIKVRQPLATLFITLTDKDYKPDKDLEDLIKDELNVKNIVWKIEQTKDANQELFVDFDWNLTPELQAEGQARELVRQIQQLRKEAGCDLSERITVYLPSWPKEFEDYIKKETLAKAIIQGQAPKIER